MGEATYRCPGHGCVLGKGPFEGADVTEQMPPDEKACKRTREEDFV